jgi:hypothetical protein
MSISTGWVGFFDILGYANLLQRNEPETIAEEVVPLLTGTKPEVINALGTYVEAIEMEIRQDVKYSQLPVKVFSKIRRRSELVAFFGHYTYYDAH